MKTHEFLNEMKKKCEKRAQFFAHAELKLVADSDYIGLTEKQIKVRRKYLEKKAGMAVIDETWIEENMSEFLKDNPNLIENLRSKYNLI